MNFYEFARERYSVRSYKPDPIPGEALDYILEAGRIAPTACNYQPQVIYVAESAEARQKLAGVTRCTFSAPVILVICYDPTRCWHNKRMEGHPSGDIDTAIVTTHMMLAAHELGIGSCWVGLFTSQEVKEALGLPSHLEVSALMPMGYPAEDAEPFHLHNKFRPKEETVRFI